MSIEKFNGNLFDRNGANRALWNEIKALYPLLRSSGVSQSSLRYDDDTTPVSFHYNSNGKMSEVSPPGDIEAAIKHVIGRSLVDADGFELPFLAALKPTTKADEPGFQVFLLVDFPDANVSMRKLDVIRAVLPALGTGQWTYDVQTQVNPLLLRMPWFKKAMVQEGRETFPRLSNLPLVDNFVDGSVLLAQSKGC
ncbi:hypothetical protein BJX70DRAFT_395337 [Aspergillus crustosus]